MLLWFLFEAAISRAHWNNSTKYLLIKLNGFMPAEMQRFRHVSTDQSRYQRQSILFVGVDWKRKGGPVLIEAFEIVRKTYPNAILTVVGCKPDTHVGGVNEKGRVPLEELVDYYIEASIFCMPTIEEPFGIVFSGSYGSRLANSWNACWCYS